MWSHSVVAIEVVDIDSRLGLPARRVLVPASRAPTRWAFAGSQTTGTNRGKSPLPAHGDCQS